MIRFHRLAITILCTFFLCACSEIQLGTHLAKRYGGESSQSQGLFKVGKPYEVQGRWYYPTETYSFEETGIASWYGAEFHGRRTANGEVFDKNELTGAHRTLQLPSLVRVTNLENGRSTVLRINDRGPFSRGRVLDVTEAAAQALGFRGQGTARVKLQVLGEESRKIADAARRGLDTRRTEVAMNTGGAQPEWTTPEPNLSATVPGHEVGGRFLPAPVVTQGPVLPTNIYVQAGAFTVPENAHRLAQALGSLGQTGVTQAYVGGVLFHRVRIGPFTTVPEADAILSSLIARNNAQAIIVVE
jgi:rare lipoprotein A